MAGTFLKWLVPGIVTVVAGTALAASQTDANLGADLSRRASVALEGEQFGWARIAISGRDAIISGTATSQAAIDSAIDRVAGVRGIRAVTSEVALAEFISPFPFTATVKDGTISLGGAYPDEALHAALVAAAGKPTDSMHLASGAPAGFGEGARYALSAAANLDDGEARLTDTRLTIEGRAKSPAAFEALRTLAESTPAGIELAALKVTPPLVSPYVWTAKFDGKTVSVTGNAPGPGLADDLRAAAPTGVTVAADLMPASGEPSGFAANAVTLLSTLIKLEHGEASITDKAIALSGAPATAAIAEQVTAAVTALGGTVTLDPPRVDDYRLVIAKTAGKLQFTGVVPDAASRDRLAALREADVAGVKLARGAPDGFGAALDFGLDVLGGLEEGQFSIDGTTLQLSGRAATVANFKDAMARVEKGAPQGLRIASSEIHPPVAKPFTWSATKAGDGAISIDGYVPDEAARKAIDAKVQKLAADRADPADGAPDGFAGFAAKGLDVLALLDTGTVKFDGTAWSIEGNVDSSKKGFAADAAYSVAGLRTAGWTYNVRLPALPIIAPYTWRAEKTAAGLTFSGFAPSDEFKDAVHALAPTAVDSTTLGAGAPADFEASATAGLAALLKLDEGALGLAGDKWTLTGTTTDTAARDAVQTALNAKVNVAAWQVAIQAKDAAPVASPYVWSATKDRDGNVVLAGYVPSAAIKDELATLAGPSANDRSTIGSGEPLGFADEVKAGLAALAHLSEGKASFDGGAWRLSGRAASAADASAVGSALQGNSGSVRWDVAVESDAPSASVASSSSEVASAPSSMAAPDVTSLEISSSSSAPPASASSSEPSSLSAPSSDSSSASEPSSSSAPSSSSSEPSSSLASSSSSEPEPASSAPPSSSVEPPSSSSAEPPVPSSSSSEATLSSSEAPASSSEAAPTTLAVVPPMPDSFVFAAVRNPGGPISLAGSVPAADTATAFGTLAGGIKTDKLTVDATLPADFAASGAAGLTALGELLEGQLGFDGSRWWLRGKADKQAAANDASSRIASLPGGPTWSVAIDVLTPIDACRAKVDVLAKRNAIVFEAGKAALMLASEPILDELAADLLACPKTYVHVQGHTDADGDADKNLALSVSRAETVVSELVKRGVDDSRFYAEGFGESDPIAPNDTKDGKAKNRRITFEITPE